MLAEPAIKVDYVAEYNKIAKPRDCDPEQNAARHYEKLFSELTSLPAALADEFKAWPTELSPREIEELEEWGTANESGLAAMAEAVRCPYWWSEVTSSDGSLPGVQLQYGDKQRELTWGVVLLAKYKASQGDSDGALRLLADLHTMGVHRSKMPRLLEQMVGLAICELGYQAVLDMLSRCDVDAGAIDRMHQFLSLPTSQIEVPRFTRGEFLVALDAFQRAFTDDRRQGGRLIPKELHRIKKKGGLYVAPLSYSEAVLICLTHPGRAETLKAYETLYEALGKVVVKRPWELHAKVSSYDDELRPIVQGNFFLEDGMQSFGRVIERGWEGRALGQAVVTVLGILAYKTEHGHLPDSLGDLVSRGYLPAAPLDPYGAGSLVYKLVGEGFTLYSVGEDFSDDGGAGPSWDEIELGLDKVFWPTSSGSEDM
jgi:hypothetical protein